MMAGTGTMALIMTTSSMHWPTVMASRFGGSCDVKSSTSPHVPVTSRGGTVRAYRMQQSPLGEIIRRLDLPLAVQKKMEKKLKSGAHHWQ